MVTLSISCPTKNGQLDQLWAGVCLMVTKTSKNVDREASERKEGKTRKSIKHPASVQRGDSEWSCCQIEEREQCDVEQASSSYSLPACSLLCVCLYTLLWISSWQASPPLSSLGRCRRETSGMWCKQAALLHQLCKLLALLYVSLLLRKRRRGQPFLASISSSQLGRQVQERPVQDGASPQMGGESPHQQPAHHLLKWIIALLKLWYFKKLLFLTSWEEAMQNRPHINQSSFLNISFSHLSLMIW